MQPLRLIVPGSYWDTQIYSGRLYLFEQSGSIRIVDWDRLLGSLGLEEELRLPLVAAFQRSDFLYGSDLVALFQDTEVRSLVQEKFRKLSQRQLLLKESNLELFTIARIANPFPFPHSDSEIYANCIYIAGPHGLSRAKCGKRFKYGLTKSVDRLFDAPVLGIACSYGTVAAAAGTEGLFEFPVDDYLGSSKDPQPTSHSACEDCNWAYHSIYATSSERGFLVEYERLPERSRRRDELTPDRDWGWEHIAFQKNLSEGRSFSGVIDSSQIFSHSGFSWGVKDKICSASNGSIDVSRYTPWVEQSERLQTIGSVPAHRPSTEIVSASIGLSQLAAKRKFEPSAHVSKK